MILDLLSPLEIALLIIGGVLTFKKVAEMERYHDLRVYLLTTVLSLVVIYLFVASIDTNSGCTIEFDDHEHFTLSEM